MAEDGGPEAPEGPPVDLPVTRRFDKAEIDADPEAVERWISEVRSRTYGERPVSATTVHGVQRGYVEVTIEQTKAIEEMPWGPEAE